MREPWIWEDVRSTLLGLIAAVRCFLNLVLRIPYSDPERRRLRMLMSVRLRPILSRGMLCAQGSCEQGVRISNRLGTSPIKDDGKDM